MPHTLSLCHKYCHTHLHCVTCIVTHTLTVLQVPPLTVQGLYSMIHLIQLTYILRSTHFYRRYFYFTRTQSWPDQVLLLPVGSDNSNIISMTTTLTKIEHNQQPFNHINVENYFTKICVLPLPELLSFNISLSYTKASQWFHYHKAIQMHNTSVQSCGCFLMFIVWNYIWYNIVPSHHFHRTKVNIFTQTPEHDREPYQHIVCTNLHNMWSQLTFIKVVTRFVTTSASSSLYIWSCDPWVSPLSPEACTVLVVYY